MDKVIRLPGLYNGDILGVTEGERMSVQERVQLCRLIERIERNDSFSRFIGITNESQFQGKKQIRNIEESFKEKKVMVG